MIYITLFITFLISYSNANNITFEGFGNADISGFSFNDNSSYKEIRPICGTSFI